MVHSCSYLLSYFFYSQFKEHYKYKMEDFHTINLTGLTIIHIDPLVIIHIIKIKMSQHSLLSLSIQDRYLGDRPHSIVGIVPSYP